MRLCQKEILFRMKGIHLSNSLNKYGLKTYCCRLLFERATLDDCWRGIKGNSTCANINFFIDLTDC